DALRWYMMTNAQPWDNLKFDEAGVEEVRRKFFGTLYNSYSVFALYANLDDFDPQAALVPYAQRPMFDRWIISKLNTLAREVKAAYEDYDITTAGRLVQDFVCDDLSNWYIRLNKKRLWGSGMSEDKLACYQTLYEVLKGVALMGAPIAPFFMERLWLDLVPGSESVHYEPMPGYDSSLVDEALEESMSFAQKASSMVLALRKKVGINVRKPLAKVLVPVLDDEVKAHIEKVCDIFLTEVNVKEIEFLHDTTGIITKKIKPNFKTLGKIYGKQMKEIAAAFGTLGQDVIAAIERSDEYVLALPSGPVTLRPGDYEITSEDMPGWLVATEGTLTVALDIVQTPELVLEGTARELIHPIQNLRKESGFELTDRIDTVVYADGAAYDGIAKALEAWGDYVASQTLSVSLCLKPLSEAPATAQEIAWEDNTIKLNLTKK
ncbi:MAG: class I tRNA ligase family protein, partial [Bacteroidales bacterium]|nr:class I tRNA ligase family protein [Bacteroidales bacterium]